MVKQNAFLDSVSSTQRRLKQDYDVEVKDTFVRKVMKNELKMRHRKVKPITAGTNSEKNLILR